jgi:enoyl-CoA hydratase
MKNQYDNILFEQLDEGVYCLTFNRPQQLNALSQQTIREFSDAVRSIESNKQVRALLLTGSGDKAFVAGADIAEFKGLNALQARALAQAGQDVLGRLERLDIPVIGVVNGFALGGGCEVALACDWIIASSNAKFGQPEINLGIMPGFGGSQRLMRRVSKPMAMDLCMSGRMIDADEALRIGLINQVYSPTELMSEALKVAGKLVKKAPLAMGFIKQVLRDGQNMGQENACALEAELFSLCFTTADQEEGVAAFLEKRKPEFSGY